MRLYRQTGTHSDVRGRSSDVPSLLGYPRSSFVYEWKPLRTVQKDGKTICCMLVFNEDPPALEEVPNPAAPDVLRGDFLMCVVGGNGNDSFRLDYTTMFDPAAADYLVRCWNDYMLHNQLSMVRHLPAMMANAMTPEVEAAIWRNERLESRMARVAHKDLSRVFAVLPDPGPMRCTTQCSIISHSIL